MTGTESALPESASDAELSEEPAAVPEEGIDSDSEIQPYPDHELLTAADPISITVESRAHGWRVDHYLCRLFPNFSRVLMQKAINEAVLLNGLPVKPGRRLRVNDQLSVRLPEKPDETFPAEDIPLDVLFEDEYMVVINKAADMIVHPGKGNYRGTLAGALQFHFDKLSDVAGKLRPGIVHRLDRHTSGVIVIAKDNQVHGRLSGQFERREVVKEYRAIIWGGPEFDEDWIETFVRVNPKHREKMQVCEEGGNARHAVTWYGVIERYPRATYVRMLPKTGRTHQLRIHMAHLGHSIVADSMYGGHMHATPADLGVEPVYRPGDDGTGATVDETQIPVITRQALHAYRLTLRHPESGKEMTFEAPLPDDFKKTLDVLNSTL